VCGNVFRDTDPDRALEALRRSVLIAQDSGNRLYETQFLYWLARLEAEQGDRMAAFEYLAVAIRNNHDSGNTGMLHIPLAILATFLDRLGRYEPAATIAGFAAVNPMAATTLPDLGTAITHLRDVLGEATYESLARKGETMTTTAMATYAYDQIDQARTELTQPG
jgi:tetratricopeptide (TPR) repeat protein